MNEQILCFFGLVIIILSLKWFKKYWYSRHNRNIRKAKSILSQLRVWEGKNVNARILSYLRKIDPFIFEELVLESLKDFGYKIIRNKRYTGDGGIDGVVYDGAGNTYAIQSKRYKSHISKQHVIDFQRIITQKCMKGFFVHTGKTGSGCHDVLKNSDIEIISGSKLINLIRYQS